VTTTESTPGGADLEALEQERQFLLRSLADLDAELEAGDIEEDDYRTLSDDYTARAATVLKAIEAMATPRPAVTDRSAARSAVPSRRRAAGSPPLDGNGPGRHRTAATPPAGNASGTAGRRRVREVAVVGGVAVFVGLATWGLIESTGARKPGQTITGNAQLSGASTTVPGGIDPRLAEAVQDVSKGQPYQALQLYAAILKDDPNQPVALANQGWLEAQIGLEYKQPDLVTKGLASIVASEKADPSYAEPHFFRGDVLLHQNDDADAVTEFRTFMGLADPSDPNIGEAQTLLAQAIKGAGSNVPPGPNAAATTTTG
jgi:hypothetical protein